LASRHRGVHALLLDLVGLRNKRRDHQVGDDREPDGCQDFDRASQETGAAIGWVGGVRLPE
jgi:hypothetical protein